MIRLALRLVLPAALPIAVRWARRHETRIRERGFPLDPGALQDAWDVGVRHPELIRVLLAPSIPDVPLPPLRWAARTAGLSLAGAAGLSLGYGLYVRSDCFPDRQLLVHECVHTAQYERLGGLRPFLHRYLEECLRFGYLNAPLEREAVRIACRFS